MRKHLRFARKVLCVIVAALLLATSATPAIALEDEVHTFGDALPDTLCICTERCFEFANSECTHCMTDISLCQGAVLMEVIAKLDVVCALYTADGEFYLYDAENASILWNGPLEDTSIINHLIFDSGVSRVERSDLSRLGDAPNLKTVSLNAVEELSGNVFQGFSNLTSVYFGGKLKTIGEHCFEETGLGPELILPESLRSIGTAAFANCEGLQSVVINGGISTIGEAVFSGCSDLASVVFGADVRTIGKNAFAGSGIKTLALPSALKTIEEGAFRQNDALVSVTFGGSLESIGAEAFEGSGKLASLALPDSLKKIGARAFLNCAALKSVKLPGKLSEIGDGAFQASGLTTLELPASLSGQSSFGTAVFADCTDLRGAIIPSGIGAISARMFAGCDSLRSVILPETLEHIGDGAFVDSGISRIIFMGDEVDDWNPDAIVNAYQQGVCEIDVFRYQGRAWGQTPTHLSGHLIKVINGLNPIELGDVYLSSVQMGDRLVDRLPDVELPLTIESGADGIIVDEATGEVRIDGALLPDAGKKHIIIEDSASPNPIRWDVTLTFHESIVKSLVVFGATNVVFDRITGEYTCFVPPDAIDCEVLFEPQDKLTYTSGNGVVSLTSGAGTVILRAAGASGIDYECTLNILPDPDTSAHNSALYASDGRFYRYDPATGLTGEELLQDADFRAASLYFESDVQAGFISTVRSGKNISIEAVTRIRFLNDVAIGNAAFDGFTNLKSVNFERATAIDASAFCCTPITSISALNPNVTLSPGAFIGMSRLTSVNLSSAQLSTIPERLFAGDASLSDVILGDIDAIGEYAFRGCTSLKTIIFPSTLASIAEGAFQGSGLEKIKLPQTLNLLGANAFSGTEIDTIRVPSVLTASHAILHSKAFAGMQALRSIGFVGLAPTGLDLTEDVVIYVGDDKQDPRYLQAVEDYPANDVRPYKVTQIHVFVGGEALSEDGEIPPLPLDGAEYDRTINPVTFVANGYMPTLYLKSTEVRGMMIYGNVLGGRPAGFTTNTSEGNLTIAAYNDAGSVEKIISLRSTDENATLGSLTIKVGDEALELDPPFDPDHETYKATIGPDVVRIDIVAETTSKHAKVPDGVGSIELEIADFNQEQSTVYPITITAESGKTKTYMLTMNRRQGALELGELEILNLSLDDFSGTKYLYEKRVAGKVESVKITKARPIEDSSIVKRVKLNGVEVNQDSELKLNYGRNEIEIEVTNTTGNSQIYRIVIYRDKDMNRLASLSAEDVILSPDFVPDVQDYHSTVPYTLESTVIQATTEDADARISGDLGIVRLAVGVNRFSVICEAQDGTRRTYTIEIIREPGPDVDPDPVPTIAPTTPEDDESEGDSDGKKIFVILTPLSQGASDIAVLVSPRAKVTMSVGGATYKVEADDYGYALLKPSMFEKGMTVKFRVKETGGDVITRVMEVAGQAEGEKTNVSVFPVAGLKACFDGARKCYAVPLNKLTADIFDAEGNRQLALLVGGVYQIGWLNVNRGADGRVTVTYSLFDQFMDAEIQNETLAFYSEIPGDEKLLQARTEKLGEPTEVAWEKPVWLKLNIHLKVDIAQLNENMVDYQMKDPCDPRVDDYRAFQRELHGK